MLIAKGKRLSCQLQWLTKEPSTSTTTVFHSKFSQPSVSFINDNTLLCFFSAAKMTTNNHMQPLPPFLLSFFLLFSSISAIEFIFNGFNNASDVLLFGNATVDSRILTLTHHQRFSIGRALFPAKIATKKPNSSYVYPFSTSFIFTMAPFANTLPGHGLVFIFTPVTGIQGTSSAQHLGLFNLSNNGSPSNHVFGVEFDVFMNQEFNDLNANHVGVDMNSLKSVFSHDAGYWPEDRKSEDDKSFKELMLNNGENYQVWIDYEDSMLNVTMAKVGVKRPSRPLMNVSLNLSEVFVDEMFVGFTSATGQLVESHKILAWSFSNTNFSLSEELVTTGLPSFVLPQTSIVQSKGFAAGVTIGVCFFVCLLVLLALFLIQRRRRMIRKRNEMEDWELEYWPHRMTYEEIEAATKMFSEENVIGVGGNGKVYKGVLGGGEEVAVKRISHENDGVREFLAEISSLGRLKQRNLVGLRGWCKKDMGNFLLVYEYMENGSLDKRVFDCDESKMLGLEDRTRIIKDVASAIMYLHEGWEVKVVHRDIKASNVLLDRDMNGRLGDFGLARMHNHDHVASTTKLVGTVGYMAPEVIKTGRASTRTDVYMFGILVLEVMCGRRPLEEGKPPLVEWVWKQMVEGELVNAIDETLRAKEEFSVQEMERVLHLGLLCAYPEPKARPTMRQVLNILEGKNEGEDSEIENMDTYLLNQLNSRDLISEYSQYFCFSTHPTLEDINLSSSMSSWSKSSIGGR
ncbi:L-type lectin-domain containing receptor kinase VII.1-like [Lotus japonicus]|uniref:L-type lectin-domain containing receptor kinase VII.1-like n=1 Tax=Lotus japonicus TaxID=34305 RepID=UPI00258A3333|nr:L-type lectin-domain containing receptor kinase VII.1-like [Lotus japonicus]